jgi:hypothetical protein
MEARRSPSLVALLLVSACAAATPTELFAPADAAVLLPTEPVSGTSGDPDASSPMPPPSSGDGDSPADGGVSETSSPPPDGCLVEKEPNDDPEHTEWFTHCFEGTVKKDDTDFASIRAPQTAARLTIEHQETGGPVRYRLYMNGLGIGSFTSKPPDFLPAFGGVTYSFEISTAGSSAAARHYELTVTFE